MKREAKEASEALMVVLGVVTMGLQIRGTASAPWFKHGKTDRVRRVLGAGERKSHNWEEECQRSAMGERVRERNKLTHMNPLPRMVHFLYGSTPSIPVILQFEGEEGTPEHMIYVSSDVINEIRQLRKRLEYRNTSWGMKSDEGL